MRKEIINIKVSDIFKGFPDFEQQQQTVIVHKKSDRPRRLSLKDTNIFHKKKHLIMKKFTAEFQENLY